MSDELTVKVAILNPFFLILFMVAILVSNQFVYYL